MVLPCLPDSYRRFRRSAWLGRGTLNIVNFHMP
jgi:hypothetical protein